MSRVGADHGLLVAWGGIQGRVQEEARHDFFKVRIWTQEDIVSQLLALYERLDPNVQAELPLKRIWVLAQPGE
jgi:restriction system protein